MSQTKDGGFQLSVIGAGTMGSGIALAALYAGWRVRLYDVSQEMLDQAESYLEEYLERKSNKQARQNLSLHESMGDLREADIWIEAAPEKLSLKQDIFQSMESVAGSGAVLATNTSTLSIAAIASATKTPERVIGMHFFNPAAVMPLVEVVAPEGVEDAVVERAKQAALALGKTPVVVSDTPGFIVNRVARPYYSEGLQLLTEGIAAVEQIDRLAEGIGFPMGPFKLMDFIGNDVNFAATQSVFEQTFMESRYRPHVLQQRMVQAGKLGRKTGEGFYKYPLEQAEVQPEEFPPSFRGSVHLEVDGIAPGIEDLLARSNLEIADSISSAQLAILALRHSADMYRRLESLERELPAEAPVLCQAITTSRSKLCQMAEHPERIIGFDSMFFEVGEVASLVVGQETSAMAKQSVSSFVRTLEKRIVWIKDAPAMVLPRLVAMLVNEAAFAVQEGIASPEDIDRAMELGVRYPQGPLAWGRSLGFDTVLHVLVDLRSRQGDPRYRPALALRRWANGDG